jgi:sialate O-acetylesterase
MTGIQSGMVMQRGSDDACEIYLESGAPIQEARYTSGTGGECSACVTPCGDRYKLSGIPVGGPYRVTIDGQAFDTVYVGDVWILGGQSNMEGISWYEPQDFLEVTQDVRAFYMTDEWGAAKHPLHELWKAVDKVHTHTIGTYVRSAHHGFGPGVDFAVRLRQLAGVPQGLLCCAHGGTSMSQWSQALKGEGADKSLYAAMLRRVRVNGGHVRGMFWYQGCSDAKPESCGAFTSAMEAFAAACRADIGELPIVQVQIGRRSPWALASETEWNSIQTAWSSIQEQQRVLETVIPNLRTIAAVQKGLDDAIHIDRQGQAELGREAAEAMYNLLYGTDGRGCLPPPALKGIAVAPRDAVTEMITIDVRFDNLHGGLTSLGRPAGFALLDPEHSLQRVIKIRLTGDVARLYTNVESLAGCRLFYGGGMNPYCNITDCAGRSVPAFEPVYL